MARDGWLHDVVRLFLPVGCVSCGAWIPDRADAERELVCLSCRGRMRAGSWPRCSRCHWPRGTRRAADLACRECAAWPPALHAARFAFELRPPTDDLVHGLKYEGWRELAGFMGDAMARLELPWPSGAGAPIVVPVPTTGARMRARGYNQAALLAGRVAIRLELDLVPALRRDRAGSSQTMLTPDERRRNVRGVFALTSAASRIRGRPVLLVDDVLTTGATVSEATERLAQGGAGPVIVATFARAVAHGARRAA